MVQLARAIILHWVVMVMEWHVNTSKSSSRLEELAHLHLCCSVTNIYFSLELPVCIFLSLFALEIRWSSELFCPNLSCPSFGFRKLKLDHVVRIFHFLHFCLSCKFFFCLFVCLFITLSFVLASQILWYAFFRSWLIKGVILVSMMMMASIAKTRWGGPVPFWKKIHEFLNSNDSICNTISLQPWELSTEHNCV